MNDIPDYTLIRLFDDDTMSVICHWHTAPSEEEVSDMVDSLLPDELMGVRCIMIARTIAAREVMQ